jgi:hypothetical protein
MRWYGVGQTRGGGTRYIEAEVADQHLTEDANDNIVTREEALADPELAAALRDWDEGDDRVRTIGRAEWAVLDAIGPIRLGLADLRIIADLAEELQAKDPDPFLEAAAALHSLLSQAEKVIVDLGLPEVADPRSLLAVEA